MENVKKNYNLILGGAITAVMLLLILTGFFWTPYDPESMEAANKFAGISLAHPLGCDNFGRDILSRVMKGAGTTFSCCTWNRADWNCVWCHDRGIYRLFWRNHR